MRFPHSRSISSLFLCLILSSLGLAQDSTTGAFEGAVTDNLTGAPSEGALAEIINLETNIIIVKRTDSRGKFYQGLLKPGVYRIRISMPKFQTREVIQRLSISRTGEVI